MSTHTDSNRFAIDYAATLRWRHTDELTCEYDNLLADHNGGSVADYTTVVQLNVCFDVLRYRASRGDHWAGLYLRRIALNHLVAA